MSSPEKTYELKKDENGNFVFKIEKPYEWYGVTINKVETHTYNEEEIVELYFQIKKILGRN